MFPPGPLGTWSVRQLVVAAPPLIFRQAMRMVGWTPDGGTTEPNLTDLFAISVNEYTDTLLR